MRRPLRVWLSIGAGLVALDLWCDRNPTPGDTLSEATRLLFHTDSRLGRAAFITSWAGLTGWLIPHICRITIQEA